MSSTSIEWCDAVWNPVRGCTRVSEGCRNCYAERMAARFSGPHSGPLGLLASRRRPGAFEGFAEMTPSGPHWTGRVELIPSKLEEPFRWRKPRRVFVNSMSDLFHEALPDTAVLSVFSVMERARRHTFQVLTKRAERMRVISGWLARKFADEMVRWPLPNIWLGVSCEDRTTLHRLIDLRHTPASVRFVSFEPLLDDLGSIDLDGINWVIVGGESGPGARPCDVAWIRSVVQQCREAAVPCFVKQMGDHPHWDGIEGGDIPRWPQPRPVFYDHGGACCVKLNNPKGGDPAEWPEDLRVREFPR